MRIAARSNSVGKGIARSGGRGRNLVVNRQQGLTVKCGLRQRMNCVNDRFRERDE